MNMPKCSTCRRWKKEYWCIECNYEAKDLVEVVRCKDCKHFNDGDCEELPKIVSETDYCSFAEPKGVIQND